MSGFSVPFPRHPRFRALLALCAGALVTLAHPPFGILPVLLIAFPVFIWLLDAADSTRRAFWTGWFFGFGHFVTGLYWIAYSLLVEPDLFAWLIPFSVCLIPAILAFLIAILGAIYHRFFRGRAYAVFAFAALWVLLEMVRNVLMTGFPWNLMGYVWTVSEIFIQPAAYVGVLGLSFLAVFLFALPARAGKCDGNRLMFTKKLLMQNVVMLCIAVFGLGLFGLLRIAAWEEELAHKTGDQSTHISLVQASSPAFYRWEPDQRMQEFLKHVMLTNVALGKGPVDMVIWPESGAPFFLEEEEELRGIMAEVAPEEGVIITGTKRKKQHQNGEWQLWNSLIALDATGKIRANYDKERLVPFGEYVPYAEYLPFVKKITHGGINFSRGPGRDTLKIDDLPSFSPLICYEVIYGGDAIDQSRRPDFIVNITNDAWFRRSLGPYQHFHMAQMRAVEEGLPLARAANTGISGMFDSLGRIVGSLPLYHVGTLDVVLPKAQPQTVFGKWGHVPVLLTLMISVLEIIFLRRN